MPHQCTNCGRTFADGSKEMLSGCPDCGGNKFQFRPAGRVDEGDFQESTPDAEPPEADAPVGDDGGLADAAARAGAAVRDRLSGDREDSAGSDSGQADPPESAPRSTPDTDRERVDLPSDREDDAADAPEDRAQADARSDVVSSEELPAETPPPEPSPQAEEPPDADGEVIEPPSEERPDLEELRAELNDQFESIKVVNPGQYELNLMELYDRDEYIISLQEDGRYVIEVPDTWQDEEE